MYKERDPKWVFKSKSSQVKFWWRVFRFGPKYYYNAAYRNTVRNRIIRANKHVHRGINQTAYHNHTYGVKKKILGTRTHGYCVLCRKKKPRAELTIDHIVPISKGGGNVRSNLQMLCLSCHIAKDRILPKAERWDNLVFDEAFKKAGITQ